MDDIGAFEAALSFVDEYVEFNDDAASSPEIVPSFKQEQDFSTALKRGPSFTITCQETSNMVPLDLKNICDTSSFQFRLPLDDESLSQPKLLKPRKFPNNPNRVRDEAQYELLFLREKVTELETQLRKMQLNSVTRRTLAAPIVTIPRPITPALRVWKDIAARQRRWRDEAQRENVRLRRIVERKRKMATGLCALLRKQLTQQGADNSRDNSILKRRTASVLDFQGNIEDFHDLFLHLQSAYHEVDAVFAASGLAAMDIPTSDVCVREGVDSKYIEVFANKLLPFNLHDTGEAAWNHFKGIEKHFDNGGLYEKTAKNLDQPYTIIEDFTKEMFSNNSRADIKAKQIVQRTKLPDRDMILFVSSVNPVEIKHKPLDGLVYHAREYALTKPFAVSTPEHELSLFQLYVRIQFDYDPGVVYDARHVRSVVQFMIGNVGGSLRGYQERIEDALIDQALRQKQMTSLSTTSM